MNPLASFETILARYGETVTLYQSGTVQGTGRALLRPILERTRQASPTHLGISLADCCLCLGERALPFLPNGEEQTVVCGTEHFWVKNVRPIKLGQELFYWRVILQRRKEENA